MTLGVHRAMRSAQVRRLYTANVMRMSGGIPASLHQSTSRRPLDSLVLRARFLVAMVRSRCAGGAMAETKHTHVKQDQRNPPNPARVHEQAMPVAADHERRSQVPSDANPGA